MKRFVKREERRRKKRRLWQKRRWKKWIGRRKRQLRWVQDNAGSVNRILNHFSSHWNHNSLKVSLLGSVWEALSARSCRKKKRNWDINKRNESNVKNQGSWSSPKSIYDQRLLQHCYLFIHYHKVPYLVFRIVVFGNVVSRLEFVCDQQQTKSSKNITLVSTKSPCDIYNWDVLTWK